MMIASILLVVIGILHFAHGLTEYVVYPVNKRDVSACSQNNDALVKILGDSRVQIYKSQVRQITDFWFIQALESQIAIVLQIPGVDAVMENVVVAQNSGESFTNASTLTIANSTGSDQASPELKLPRRTRRDAPQDLDLVSWPPRKRIPVFGKMPWYIYDVAQGVDTFVYIIDNGINMDNSEFKSMPWSPEPDEWHYAYGVSHSTTDDNLAGHGSCVASKAAGWKTGVSKNSQLVVMKSLPTLADVNFAFAAALDDIIEKDRQGRAVVVYPATSIQTFAAGSVLPTNWQSVNELIQELFAQDVVVVTGAGNNAARSSALNTVPAMWGLSEDFPLIVAGAVTTDGTMARFSQGAATSSEIVWAPGENIVCANGPTSPGLAVRSGTSFAAAMVAGLAAYELTGPDTPPPGSVPGSIRSRLLVNSRPIYPLSRPKVIWNGQDGDINPLLENSTAQSLLQLVQEMPNSTLVSGNTNLTGGQALAE